MTAGKLFDRDEYKENMDWLIGVLKSRGHVDTQDAFNYLMLSQLTRIADSLEALDKCVGFQTPTPYMKEGYHFLRIDGYVETDN